MLVVTKGQIQPDAEIDIRTTQPHPALVRLRKGPIYLFKKTHAVLVPMTELSRMQIDHEGTTRSGKFSQYKN